MYIVHGKTVYSYHGRKGNAEKSARCKYEEILKILLCQSDSVSRYVSALTTESQ
jgi:hypothetical protein